MIATCPLNTPHIPSRYNNEQTTKQTKAINNSYIYIYIHISCKCDTNRAGHFTLDAHASIPVACQFHYTDFTWVLWRLISPANHDDVIKWKHFPRYWPFVLGIHRSPVNSPHKGQRRRALVLSLICSWTNGWVNNRNAGDLMRHRADYDVTGLTRLDDEQLFRLSTKNTLDGGFHIQMASHTENVSMSWRHQENSKSMQTTSVVRHGNEILPMNYYFSRKQHKYGFIQSKVSFKIHHHCQLKLCWLQINRQYFMLISMTSHS